MSNTLDLANSIFESLSIGAAVLATVMAVFLTFRQRDLSNINGRISAEDISRFESASSETSEPFEVEALASYYNQALIRANISFWFSLIFASIGFGVIVFAIAFHTSTDVESTLVKVGSGAIIDTVSALFFVQSTRAEKSMGAFFEKLRLDRLNAEAREMIDEVEDPERRDQLRAQMILKYSNIDRLVLGDS